MTQRTVNQLVKAQEVTEGGGVQVFRSIGSPALRNLDPFLMLDQFGTDKPEDYLAGFPEHPHRGFSTFTYMLNGHMRHRDSMGNQGDLGPGGAQWMTAASGVIHSEMPQQKSGRMRGFQLWVNLPAAQKMGRPAYQEISPAAIPEVTGSGYRVRLLAGTLAGSEGPVSDPHTRIQYLDVALEPDATFTLDLPASHTVFIYPYQGTATVAQTHIPAQHLAVVGKGEEITVSTDSKGVHFLLVSGNPIGEPIVQYGPFVMNSHDEINRAMTEYRDGTLVKTKADFIAVAGSG